MSQLHDFDRFMAAQVARIPKSYQLFMVAITTIGSFWLASFVMFGLTIIALTNNRDELLISLVVTAALVPLAEFLKLITRRTRPKTLYVQQMRFRTYSFPSGHAYVSALMAGYLIVLAFIYIASPLNFIIAIFLILFAVAVGISRVFLGAHFPSDVLAGWLLAILIIALSAPSRGMLP